VCEIITIGVCLKIEVLDVLGKKYKPIIVLKDNYPKKNVEF